MSKYIKKYITITVLNIVLTASVCSQNSFYSMLDKDTVYRYNTSLKTLDSLFSSSRKENDTSFYKQYGRAEVITLDQMIYFALNNSNDLKAMQNKIEAQNYLAKEKTSLPDPMLDFELDNIMSDFSQVGMVNFFVSQTFPFPGKLKLDKESVMHNSDMMRYDRKDMAANMISMIKMNYYDLYFIEQKLKINNDNQEIIKNFIAASESKYSVGKGMQQEVFKSQIELSKLLNDETVLKQERKDIYANLTKLTKVVIDENTKINFNSIDIGYLLEQNSFNTENINPDKLVNYAFDNRADLESIKHKIIMSETDLDMAKLSRLPDLNLKLGYRIMPFEPKNDFEFMVGINVPIAPWSSGKYSNAIQKNSISIKVSTEEYYAKRNEIKNEIVNILNKLTAAKKTMKYYSDVVIPQTENSLKSTQYSYENNMTSFLDLLDSYRMYQEAELMFDESVNMYLKMIAELEKATGMNFKN
jgi:outer membrane protein TolC